MKIVLLVLMIGIAQLVAAQSNVHATWDGLLKKHVHEGKVDYKGFITDRDVLEGYLKQLSDSYAERPKDREADLAYWINVYNAFTVKLIIDHYPVNSIKDIGKVLGPWDQKVVKLGGFDYTLNYVEHEVLRKQFGEPRIHFAIVCASESCPTLRAEAYVKERIDVQLDEQAKAFINDKSKNKMSPGKGEVSALFNWFKSDFVAGGSLVAYLNRYSFVRLNPNAEIEFLPYSWKLNE